jgi:hypothetical protein
MRLEMKVRYSTPLYRSALKSFFVGMLVLGILISLNPVWAKQYTTTGKAHRVIETDAGV